MPSLVTGRAVQHRDLDEGFPGFAVLYMQMIIFVVTLVTMDPACTLFSPAHRMGRACRACAKT